MNFLQCLQTEKTGRILIGFLLFYLLLWGILPGMILHSVYTDSAENLALSHALVWSYNKHPPLGMAVIHVASSILGRNETTSYLTSAICLLVALIYIYQISRLFLDEKEAIAATIISSLSYYFVLNYVLEYNQNTIMLPFWLASIYYLIKAMRHNKIRHWIFLSLASFLGIMAKYETIIILALALLYLLINFRKRYLYGLILATSLCVALMIPNLISLINNHFAPFHYVFSKATQSSNATHHMRNIGNALVQPFNLTLCVLVIAHLIWRKHATCEKPKKITFNAPLVFFALSPWLVFSILPFFFHTVPAEWGYPMLMLLIPGLFYLFNIKIHDIKVLAPAVVAIHLAIFSTYFLGTTLDHKRHRLSWPSRELANQATTFWTSHDQPLNQLNFVGGEEPLSWYLTAYLPSKPLFLKRNSLKASPWINPKKLAHDGIILVDRGCHKNAKKYQKKGFQVTAIKCSTLSLTNKIKNIKIPVTYYLAHLTEKNDHHHE